MSPATAELHAVEGDCGCLSQHSAERLPGQTWHCGQ